MKRIISILSVIAVIALVAFRLVNNKNEIDARSQAKNLAEMAVSVNLATVEKRTSEKELKLIGTVKAAHESNLKTEVQGKLIAVNFELGDVVKKGQVLAKVDDKIRQIALANARQKLLDAEQNFNRYKNLLEGGAATQAQYDQQKLALETARNGLEQANKEVSNSVIVSPITGHITDKMVETGDFVNVGSPIASIIDVSELKVRVNVPEKDAYALSKGDLVDIRANVFPGVRFSGKVTFIGLKGDEAHNYPVELSIANQGKNQLKAGTYVDVIFTRKDPQPTLQIPREALVGSIKDAQVYIVGSDGLARLRKVIIGNDNANYFEVIDGLKEGERVVVSGQINLKDNMKVKEI